MVTNLHSGKIARQVFVLFLALPLIACDGGISVPKNQLTVIPNNPGNEQHMVKDSFNAALGPMEDLGLRKREIPITLKQLMNNPYEKPDQLACDNIKTEIAQLDGLLGADIDAPKAALSATEQYVDTGGDILHDTVVGFVRSQTSIIPLRSIVRKVTGAEKAEKKVRRATEAGKLRRAYLRGLADAQFGEKCITGRIVVGTGGDRKIDEKDADKGLEKEK
jgi:hypothetical protein